MFRLQAQVFSSNYNCLHTFLPSTLRHKFEEGVLACRVVIMPAPENKKVLCRDRAHLKSVSSDHIDSREPLPDGCCFVGIPVIVIAPVVGQTLWVVPAAGKALKPHNTAVLTAEMRSIF